MFDRNFIPPKPRVAQTETIRRIKIIESIIPELEKYSTAMLLTGSMAYGQDYSITPDSDIDIQLFTTPELVEKLASCKFFQKYNIARIAQWFSDWVYQQFSLNFICKEVTVECHFWDEKTYKDILLYKRENVVRLRSQTKKISTDYAYSFDEEEDVETYPDYKEGSYNLWKFSAYRVKKKKIFLSRPITNILGNAIVLFDACGISVIINECRTLTENKIAAIKQEKWKTYSIFNALSGKNKVAEDVKIMLI